MEAALVKILNLNFSNALIKVLGFAMIKVIFRPTYIKKVFFLGVLLALKLVNNRKDYTIEMLSKKN